LETFVDKVLPMTEPAALAHEAIYDTVQRILADKPRGRLLDVPAGEGALTARLAADGFEVVPADLYPELFKLEGLEINKADLDGRLPFEDDSFQTVVCVEGLEHIENPASAVREFSRVLKKGGTLIVSVPNIMNIEERFKWLLGGYTSHFKPLSRAALDRIAAESEYPDEVVLHVNPIGYAEFRFLLEKNGFELRGVHRDKAKANSWAFIPVVAAIRGVSRLASRQKRAERWADEMNSDEVLLGGNTLIFEATKL
jgi:SAM-dependent methyltransferase